METLGSLQKTVMVVCFSIESVKNKFLSQVIFFPMQVWFRYDELTARSHKLMLTYLNVKLRSTTLNTQTISRRNVSFKQSKYSQKVLFVRVYIQRAINTFNLIDSESSTCC